MSDKESFVIILRPAPKYGQPGSDDRVSEHFEYLKKLNQDGKVMMAGRFTDVLFGLVMIEVGTEKKLRKLCD